MIKSAAILIMINLFLGLYCNAQTIGINTNGGRGDVSSIFDVSDSLRGFLVPRVTDTIVVNQAATSGGYSLAEGLMIYDLTDHCLRINNGAKWSKCLLNNQDTIYCGSKTQIVEVTSSTGAVWMDRNLGAYRLAVSSTDIYAYGSLYQWGRFADGHQCRSSFYTNGLAYSSYPNHNMFIKSVASPYDWRSPQNNNLWQGIYGVNNPCPIGFRLPTEAEWSAERTIDFTSNDAIGAYSGALKLTVGGRRNRNSANIALAGSNGYYWSSTVGATFSAKLLYLTNINTGITSYGRAFGATVRCIKN